MSWQEIYRKNIPSVVSVSCTGWAGAANGSGVVIACNGYIVTNAHLVMDAEEILIRLSDGRTFPAALVGSDSASDLAVVHIDATNLIPAEFGNSGALRVGDAVAAIGDPLGAGFRGTMTDGIISAINRDVAVEGRTMTLIQTNAALNSGNSGGPLLNCYGQVIGINTMKISAFVDSAGVEGIGFAIPSATVKTVVEQLMNQGYVSGRPALNIEGSSVSAFDQRFNRLPAGVLVSKVAQNSCSQVAGLEVGDIILSLGGVRVESTDALSTILYNYNAGDTVQMEIYRYRTGKQYTLTLVLDEAVRKTS
jgi:serine protease Do